MHNHKRIDIVTFIATGLLKSVTDWDLCVNFLYSTILIIVVYNQLICWTLGKIC